MTVFTPPSFLSGCGTLLSVFNQLLLAAADTSPVVPGCDDLQPPSHTPPLLSTHQTSYHWPLSLTAAISAISTSTSVVPCCGDHRDNPNSKSLNLKSILLLLIDYGIDGTCEFRFGFNKIEA